MKVQELLTIIKNEEFNLESALEIKKYTPLELKKTIAQSIIFECTEEEDGVIRLDSVQKHVAYTRYLLTAYTNLEYTDEDFDTLCSTELQGVSLIDAIIVCFEDDAVKLSNILDMMLDDYLKENSMEFAIIKALNKTVKSVESVTENINSKIGNFDVKSLISDNLDIGQVMSFLEIYGR